MASAWRLGRALNRFAHKVKFVGECWIWTGSLNQKGYSQFRDEYSRMTYGHRFSYEFFVGKIPRGLQIDHKCRNKKCVNPRHLEPVTRIENMYRWITSDHTKQGDRP